MSPTAAARLGFCLALVLAVRAVAATPAVPAYAVLPAGVAPAAVGYNEFEAYGQFRFENYGPTPFAETGRHWHQNLRPVGVPAGLTNKDEWGRLKPIFAALGWTVVAESATQPYGVTLHIKRPGLEAWAFLGLSSPDNFDYDVVEAAAEPLTLTLAAPGARPEPLSASGGDIPYLAPLPGSKRHGVRDSGPMTVTPAGVDEPILVAPGSLTFSYDLDGLSNLQFDTVYHAALAKAGWTIAREVNSASSSDAVILAHYASGGRDIWAYLHATPGTYSITVADAGAKGLGGEFAAACHVALLGVVFDFNKASLKPESEPVLTRAVRLIHVSGDPHVEVQGHTDAVGSDAYNQTLSEARARSVVAWLVAHGIAPGRLTAKGYGKTRPIADNATDLGRAKNRRVEIANLDCRAK
ncbi:MAG: OmpA family protein [Caulobacterales bacterium]